MTTLLSNLNLDQVSLNQTTSSNGRMMVSMKNGNEPLLIQLNCDETDLFTAPFGLDRESDLYPDPKHRNLRLIPSTEFSFQTLDDFIKKQYEMHHAAWGVPADLEYSPLVKPNEDVGAIIRVKLGLQTTVVKKFHKKGVINSDYTCITPGSECLVLVSVSGIWFQETRYGVTLNCKLILVKPGEKRDYDINDLILQSQLDVLE